MPAIDDIVQFTVLSEQEGVQGSNTFQFRITDLGNSPAVVDMLDNWAVLWVNTLSAILSLKWAVVCVIYENLTDATDPVIKLNKTIPGVNFTENPHPSNFGVWFIRYSKRAIQNPNIPSQAVGKIISGRFFQTGFILSNSKVGRAQENIIFSQAETFLITPAQFPAGGYELTPSLRYSVDRVPGPVQTPPIATDDQDITDYQLNPVYSRLRSRTSKLCGQAE